MDSVRTQLSRARLPRPRWSATAWLLAPRGSVGTDVAAELHEYLLRRLEAVLVSGLLSVAVAVVAVSYHPLPALRWWLVLDLAIAGVRVPVAVAMMRFALRRDRGTRFSPWIVDLFVWSGTFWSALLGFGTFLCVVTGDTGLAVLASVLAMGTMGVQSVRNPATPRLNTLQMSLVIVPAAIGFALSPIPHIRWAVALAPFYLIGMVAITRQLHADYVSLLSARIANRHHALHCPLTGLPNRLFFGEALKAGWQGACGSPAPVCVLYLDLDGFKAVNDAFGHAVGDRVLRGVALRLQGFASPEVIAARLGGDEFAVLLRFDDVGRIEATARAVIESIGQPYRVEGTPPLTIGVSIGIAAGAGAEDLLERADAALYAAKRAGRGTFRWHLAEDNAAAESLRMIARRMRTTYDSTARPSAARG